MDRALEDLCSAVKDLCGGHRRAHQQQQEREGVNGHHPSSSSSSSSPAALHLLSDVNQDTYHQSEDQYLAQLIDHTKKQFFKVSDFNKLVECSSLSEVVVVVVVVVFPCLPLSQVC